MNKGRRQDKTSWSLDTGGGEQAEFGGVCDFGLDSSGTMKKWGQEGEGSEEENSLKKNDRIKVRFKEQGSSWLVQ